MDDGDSTADGGTSGAGSSSGSSGSSTATSNATDVETACPQNYAPVCGKDGNTYDNACLAQAAGVEIRRNTPCVGDCTDACQLGDGGGTLATALVLVLLLHSRPRR